MGERSQRHLSAALAELGFSAGQKLVGRLLKRLGFSLQANAKTREGTSHPDRNAQFEHINAEVKAFQAAGEPVISVARTGANARLRHSRTRQGRTVRCLRRRRQ
jgi:Rhodopirellula transposase DDE domain